MEEKMKIGRIKLDLQSYIKMTFVFGLCLGILGAILNLGLDVFSLFTLPQGVDLSGRLSVFGFGLAATFVSLLVTPISMAIVGVITYPIYNYVTNRFFTLSVSGYGEVEH